jgi:hypothetical protein
MSGSFVFTSEYFESSFYSYDTRVRNNKRNEYPEERMKHIKILDPV